MRFRPGHPIVSITCRQILVAKQFFAPSTPEILLGRVFLTFAETRMCWGLVDSRVPFQRVHVAPQPAVTGHELAITGHCWLAAVGCLRPAVKGRPNYLARCYFGGVWVGGGRSFWPFFFAVGCVAGRPGRWVDGCRSTAPRCRWGWGIVGPLGVLNGGGGPLKATPSPAGWLSETLVPVHRGLYTRPIRRQWP